jgi:hypothetical protein
MIFWVPPDKKSAHSYCGCVSSFFFLSGFLSEAGFWSGLAAGALLIWAGGAD